MMTDYGFGVGEVTNLPDWADELPDALPHGSGIDGDWVIEGHAHHITLRNGFHCMDEYGGYDGWANFSAIIKPYTHKQPDESIFRGISVEIHFHGADSQYKARKHMLREYLGDTIHQSISDLVWGKGFEKCIRKNDMFMINYELERISACIQPHVISGTPSFGALGEAMEHLGSLRNKLKV